MIPSSSRFGPGDLCGARQNAASLPELNAGAQLPFLASGLSRTRLDASLLDLAVGQEVEGRRGTGVRSLARTDGRAWHAMLGDGRSILTRTAVLASGKDELRGH
jgi:hypothetical protein